MPNVSFLACLDVARLVRLVRLARFVRLVRLGKLGFTSKVILIRFG